MLCSSLQTYIVPQASLFGVGPSALNNNIRVYGTILLLLLTIIVFVGVKIVSPTPVAITLTLMMVCR